MKEPITKGRNTGMGNISGVMVQLMKEIGKKIK
jgi:hypothetical protein